MFESRRKGSNVSANACLEVWVGVAHGGMNVNVCNGVWWKGWAEEVCGTNGMGLPPPSSAKMATPGNGVWGEGKVSMLFKINVMLLLRMDGGCNEGNPGGVLAVNESSIRLNLFSYHSHHRPDVCPSE